MSSLGDAGGDRTALENHNAALLLENEGTFIYI